MKTKRVIAWGIGVVMAAAIGYYVELVREMRDYHPSILLACMDVEKPWLAWTCKQVLRYGSLRPDQVKNLNRERGTIYPASMKDITTAEEMLSLFIAKGVDINTVNESGRDWTALYDMSLDGNVERAKLLLKHGARANIRDQQGMTPLDIARIVQQKHPAEPNRAEIVRLLEAAEKQQEAVYK